MGDPARVRARVSRRAAGLARGRVAFLALLVAVGLAWSPGAAGADPAPQPLSAAPPAAPSQVTAEDVPNDDGHALEVRWTPSPDDERPEVLSGYRLLRSEAVGSFVEVRALPPGARRYVDRGVAPGAARAYRVVAFGPGGESASEASAPATPTAQWFDRTRTATLLLMLVVCAAIWLNILRAQAGRPMYIRRIAGMDAVDEAVGRATEMGQPVLYIAGLQDMDNVQTVAGITILGSIAKLVAEYETSLLMPTSRSLVMSTARETVKEAYLAAGRPDAYREDGIYYVTDEQFGFVAHVDGLMLRRKPAACFFLGAFFAESLILAETGNSIGAIQVAGTAMPTQLPFFVAACDYTLIGEELFAASAYLSQDEKMLGSLKGQDVGKVLAMGVVAVGSVLATIAVFSDAPAVAAANRALQWLFSGGGS
jgi:hypothetical protein